MNEIYNVQTHFDMDANRDRVGVFATKEAALENWRMRCDEMRNAGVSELEEERDEPTDTFFYGKAVFETSEERIADIAIYSAPLN